MSAAEELTDNFWANDILWQLNVFAYNISVDAPEEKQGKEVNMRKHARVYERDMFR